MGEGGKGLPGGRKGRGEENQVDFGQITALVERATMGTYHGLAHQERTHNKQRLEGIKEGLLNAFKRGKRSAIADLLDELEAIPRHQVARGAAMSLYCLL